MGGLGGWLAGARLPAVPGGDVAGTVVEADASSPFKPGALAPALVFHAGSGLLPAWPSPSDAAFASPLPS